MCFLSYLPNLMAQYRAIQRWGMSERVYTGKYSIDILVNEGVQYSTHTVYSSYTVVTRLIGTRDSTIPFLKECELQKTQSLWSEAGLCFRFTSSRDTIHFDIKNNKWDKSQRMGCLQRLDWNFSLNFCLQSAPIQLKELRKMWTQSSIIAGMSKGV